MPSGTPHAPEPTDPHGFAAPDQPSYPPAVGGGNGGIYVSKTWVGIVATLATGALMGAWAFIWSLHTTQNEMQIELALMQERLVHINDSIDRIEQEVSR